MAMPATGVAKGRDSATRSRAGRKGRKRTPAKQVEQVVVLDIGVRRWLGRLHGLLSLQVLLEVDGRSPGCGGDGVHVGAGNDACARREGTGCQGC